MQVPENDVTWTYSLLNASESKASARTGTPPGFVAELVGIDGTNNGGLMPFPGFRGMHTFTPDTWNIAYGGVVFAGGTNPYTNLAHKCRVVDFWSFSLIAGASTRVWGFVYVVRRANSGSCSNVYDLMMEFYAPQTGGTVVKSVILLDDAMTDGGLLADGGAAVMSVETTGKAVYVFRRGASPVAVYFKYTSTPSVSTIASVIDPAGPGKRINGQTYAKTADGNFSNGSTHTTASLPDPTALSGSTYTNPPGSFVLCSNASNAPPVSSNYYNVSNITTAAGLKAGSYSIAVQFEDSKSGRKSQLSNNIDMTIAAGSDHYLWIDGVYDSSRFDTLNVYRSVRTEEAAGSFTHGILQLEAQITLSSYAVTYANFPWAATPTYGANALLFRYAYQLKDAALVMQDVFLDKPSYSETMPKGGAGALLDGTMLVGNISDSAGDLTGTGETRWSASGVDSPELFTAQGQYKPSNVGDAVTCFKRTGQLMAGFTRNGVQFFSKQDGFVRVLAAHQGYGITGPYAATTVGPVTYYINYRGLKAVFPDGKLDDVQAINQLVGSEWYSDTKGSQELSKVSMAFDPATLCMYILNPVRAQAVQMWFATGVVSELEDMSFAKVTQGWWKDDDGQLVPRALFLSNAPYPDLVTNTAYRPTVYMPSRTYSDKTYSEAAADQVSMLDAKVLRNPQTKLTTATTSTGTYYDSTCTSTSIALKSFTNLFTPTTTSEKIIGAWVYLLWPSATGSKPVRAQILNATSTTVTVARYVSNGLAIEEFDPLNKYLGLDPVYVRVVCSPLRMSEDKAEEFVIKQPTSMGAVLSDVSWYAPEEAQGEPMARYWMGSIYRSNEVNALLSTPPTNPDGTVAQFSIVNGDSANWAAFGKHSYLGQWFFPGFQTFVPNLKYRLVGLQVKGRMLPTDRTRRTY